MLRIIDMSEAKSSEYAFAVWDTVTDGFIYDSFDDQVWHSFDEFKLAFPGNAKLVERVSVLLPNTPTSRLPESSASPGQPPSAVDTQQVKP